MGYKVLYIEQSHRLSLYLDNIKIEREAGDVLYPLKDVMTLIIDNDRTVLSLKLMNKLTENNVCTILCGIDHLPKSYILPMNGNFASSGNINKQIVWQEETKLKLHKLIVQAKIKNQIDLLNKYNYKYELIQKLNQFHNEVELGDVTNREGLVAKMYFRALFGDNFKRFDEDVINAGLNYGYSILRSLIATVIVSKGYLPNMGIFHKGKTNMFNLADDLIETFRPIVDRWVYEHLLEEIIFKKEHRENLIKLSTSRVFIDERSQTIFNAVNLYMESILKVLDTNNEKHFIYPSVIVDHDL